MGDGIPGTCNSCIHAATILAPHIGSTRDIIASARTKTVLMLLPAMLVVHCVHIYNWQQY